MSEETQKTKKLDIKLTFFIGLAFFTTGISWSLYNTQVNQALLGYLKLFSIVGILMAVDNIIGVIIQPIMGSVSDSTRSRLGRRMPYIIIGTISAAIFFALIPTGFDTQLWILLLWMFLFSISMGFYRSQAVALMPDFIRPHNRSKANAIINLMGGIGTLLATLINLAVNYIGLQLAFILGSLLMLGALGILVWKVKESEAFSYQLILKAEQAGKETVADIQPQIKKPGLIESLKDIAKEKDKSTLFILLAIFFWFIAYQGAEGLFTAYAGPEGLGIVDSKGTAGFLLFFVAAPFILFAYPAGIIANKIGRRLTIKIGLGVILFGMVFAFIIQTNLTMLLIGLIIFGLGWGMVNVNSIVIVWELAPSAEKIGTYTGVYYFFSVLAAILGPYVIGSLMDLFGISSMFLNCAMFFLISLILMFFVKRGEIELTEEEKIAKEKAMERL
ncbi:MAG: MFS transporter [Candidatus Lokiarchaeota archaeon]|nr:MFS transporter [Candidatus Lokiarchaeota archaeon]